MRRKRTISPARLVAHRVLMRVQKDDAWADRALDAALQRSRMTPEDKALATEIVYGTLRSAPRLDFYIGELVRRPMRKIQASALAALRMGAYQLLEMRIPAHAAVHESVSLAAEQSPHQQGFVNAVLRKLSTLAERGELPDPEKTIPDKVEALAVAKSHPAWLVEAVLAVRGEAATRAWLDANNVTPAIVLRANTLRGDPGGVLDSLRAAGVEVEPHPHLPAAMVMQSAGDVRTLPGFAAGTFTIQDTGAQLVGLMARPSPGQLILDSCAAPGGKAAHLAELMNDTGAVIAFDLHPARTRLIAATAERLGLRSLRAVIGDAGDADALHEEIAREGRETVDLALVDAPCSGMGTLRRHPELRVRGLADLSALCRIQDRLLDAVADLVRPGGHLIYAVCTVTAQEGPERVRAFLERHPDYSVVAPEDPLLAPYLEDCHLGAPCLRTWTDRHDADGFFAARLLHSETRT